MYDSWTVPTDQRISIWEGEEEENGPLEALDHEKMHEFCTLSLLLSLLLNDLTKGNNQLRHIVGGINAIGELFCSLGRLQ